MEYRLWIADRWLTSENCNNISNFSGVSGRVSYDPDSRTLTLDNATITCYSEEGTCIRNYIDGGITIKLIGSNTIIPNKERGIYNHQPLTIKGVTSDATLTVRNSHMNQDIGLLNDACIYGENQTSITFKDCSVIVDGEGKGLAEGVWNFINCTVRAKGGKAGSCWNLASIPSYKDCALPTGFYWKKELKYSGYSLVDADDKVVTDWVTVAEPTGDTSESDNTHTPERYGILIAGTEVTEENYNDISNFEGVSGRVSYDPDTNTLTLDNATITNTKTKDDVDDFLECVGIYHWKGVLIIRLIGSNTVTSVNYIGIFNDDNSRFGSGLDISGTNKYDDKLTVKGGILNWSWSRIINCTVETSENIYGLRDGEWDFYDCIVCAKGGDSSDDPYTGSISYLKKTPGYPLPKGMYWKEFKDDRGRTLYTLFGADNKAVTDWVTIKNGYEPSEADNITETDNTTESGDTSEADYTRQRHEDINEGLREIKHKAYDLLNSNMYDDDYSYPEAIEDASDRDFAYILDKRESSFSEKEIYVRGSGYENIYPGAILFVDSDITSGSPNPLGRIPRSKISIYGDFLAGGNPSQSDIDPNNSDVRMAINNIMHTLLSDSRYDAPGAQRPRTKIHTSQKSLMMDLGVDSSFAGCNVNVRASTTSSEQSFVQATTLDQDYFTIRLKDDWHQDPASLFADEVTWDDLSRELNGKAIAIVTSVTYGRTFSYMKEYSARQFTFDSSQKVSGYGQSADASQSLAESSSYTNDEIFNLGGTSLTISALRGKSTQQELEEAMADNMRFSHANQGVITKYTLQLITGPTPGTVVRPLYSGTQYQIGYTKCPRRLFAHIDVSRVHIGPGKVKVQLDVDCFRITEDGEIDIFKSVDGGSSERDQDPWYYTFSNSRNREYGNLDSGEYIYKNPLLRIRSKRGGGSYTADDERRLTAREMETGALNISLSGSVYDSVKIRDLEPFNP